MLGATVLVGMVVVAAVGAGWLLREARDVAVDPEPSSLVLAAVEVAAAALLGRCGLGGLLGLAAVALGPRTSSARAALRVTPVLLRPVVSALLALSVSAVAAGPALAAGPSPDLPAAAWSAGPHSSPPRTAAATTMADLPTAGWVPATRPAARAGTSGRLVTGPPPRAHRPEGVVVRRGDSLWTIVARALGPRASDAHVAAQWPRWYEANRATIGPDPDLLQPGTTLHAPRGASR
ncbi:MAG: LysM peptidoglycan-binding domain-containing protein [Angustibacter sp.]